MVHDLGTLKRLNNEAAKKGRGRRGAAGPNVPRGIALCPAALRAFQNQPWTAAELRASGEPDLRARYARSAARPFNGRGKRERLRP